MAPRRKKGRHKTADEIKILVSQATRLMTAKVNPLSTRECAKRLKVPMQTIYYHVGSARALRLASYGALPPGD